MKRKVSFRCNEELHEKFKEYADQLGVTTSQMIELACYHFLDEQPKIREDEKAKTMTRKQRKQEPIYVRMYTDQTVFKDLVKVAQAKNATLSQECRFRLSASLSNPFFDTAELKRLDLIEVRLEYINRNIREMNKLGLVTDKALIQKAIEVTQEMYDELDKILDYVNKRFF